MSDERREMFRQLAVYSQVGMTFAFSIIIGFGIGWALDNKVSWGENLSLLNVYIFGTGHYRRIQKSLGTDRRKIEDE